MPLNRRGSLIASTYDVMLVQESMRTAGLYDGPIDGVPGARTKLAVRTYKRRHGLTVDNDLNAEFIAHIRNSG